MEENPVLSFCSPRWLTHKHFHWSSTRRHCPRWWHRFKLVHVTFVSDRGVSIVSSTCNSTLAVVVLIAFSASAQSKGNGNSPWDRKWHSRQMYMPVSLLVNDWKCSTEWYLNSGSIRSAEQRRCSMLLVLYRIDATWLWTLFGRWKSLNSFVSSLRPR